TYGMKFFMRWYRKHGDNEERAYREIKKRNDRAGDWANKPTTDRRQLERAWEQAVDAVDEPRKKTSTARNAEGRKAREIVPTDLKFSWYPFIVEGSVCVLASAGDTGKGLWCSDIVARETQKRPMPLSKDKGRGRNVLWYELEDDADAVLIRRLLTARADV